MYLINWITVGGLYYVPDQTVPVKRWYTDRLIGHLYLKLNYDFCCVVLFRKKRILVLTVKPLGIENPLYVFAAHFFAKQFLEGKLKHVTFLTLNFLSRSVYDNA